MKNEERRTKNEETRNKKQETRNKKQETRNKKQETRNKKQEKIIKIKKSREKKYHFYKLYISVRGQNLWQLIK